VLLQAQIVSADAKGASLFPARTLDLLVMDKKLRSGGYAGGREGFKAFKEDMNVLVRTAFR
jgi:hypothetical protein